MRLQRIPQRVSNCLSPFSSHFTCPQGQHFRVWTWLLTALLLTQGAAKLKTLTRLMPRRLGYWTVLRMVKAGYWDASALLDELAVAALLTLPPPTDRTLYLIGDKTTKEKTGKKMPLAHKTRMNEFAPYVFGVDLVLLLAQWGRFRIPVACELVDPNIKGHQNILFRQMLRRFQAPAWCRQIVVIADAGFASKENLRLIQELAWHYVFALPRTWKLEDGTHLKDLANHLPRKRYRRVASYKPDRRRQDYWTFVRRAKLNTLGDVTILLSKRRRNDGPKKIKLMVTNLDSPSARQILDIYCRRWSVEVTFKELKSGLHLGQMQVTKEKERVERALRLPVMAYLLLLRLYGKELNPDQGFTIFRLKQQFLDEVWQEQLDRSDAKWRKKLDQYRAAA
jgi:hypothetical protein